MLTRYAEKLRSYKGRPCYRVPVVILFNNSRACATVAKIETTVVAHSAAHAANWARDEIVEDRPETEIYAWGPKGGRVHRYVGWYSAIANAMLRREPEPEQLQINV